MKRTIVGGRPPSGGGDASFPPGIDVLLRKASVDPPFRALLLEDALRAATTIDLELTETERSVLASIAPEDLERSVDQIVVPEEHLAVFRGTVAAAMVAAVVGLLAGCGPLEQPAPTGIRPDELPPPAASPGAEDPVPGGGDSR